MRKIVLESLYEGVADKYAEQKFSITDKESEFEKSYVDSQETIVAHVKGYEAYSKPVPVIKNPKDVSKIAPLSRGIIDLEGNLYIETYPATLHSDIIEKLKSANILPKKDVQWWLLNPEETGYISVQKSKKDNAIYIGESHLQLKEESEKYYSEKYSDKEKYLSIFKKFLQRAASKNPKFQFIATQISDVNESFDKRKEDYKKSTLITDDKNIGLKKRIIKKVKDASGEDVKICLVNGDYVNAEDPGLGFKEFTEGGHYYVTSYPGYKKFIPKDEIWIDSVFVKEPERLKGFIQHEFIERNLMKYKKWTYSDAHEYANKKEAELRKKSEK